MSRTRVTLSLLARVLVGGLFAWAGLYKLYRPEEFLTAMEWIPGAGLVDRGDLALVQAIVPRVELAIALCLLLGLYLRPALVGASLCLLAFTGLILLGAAGEGGLRSCGCFGFWVLESGGPSGWITRNVLLLALSGAAVACGKARWTVDSVLVRGNR